MYMIIYKTTNLINNKFYIGKDAKNKKSYLGSGKVLKQAIQKYGKENFKKEILEYCTDLEHLDEREIYWIDKYNALEEGYNLTEGGTGGDTRTNGGSTTAGFQIGNIPWNKNKPLSESHRDNLSKKLKSLNLGANKASYKSGKDHPFYGKKRDPKIYEKIVETRKKNGTYEATAKRQMKKVINEADGKVFDSILSAAKHYNLTKDQVGNSCRGKTKKYSFRFV